MIKSKRSSTMSHRKALAIFFGLVIVGLLGWVMWTFLLKDEHFQDAAAATPKVTVKYYYLEKCPFCVKFQPEWEKFTKDMKGTNVTAVSVDGTKQNKYKSFPTITTQTTGGEETEYTGDRTAVALQAAISSSIVRTQAAGVTASQ